LSGGAGATKSACDTEDTEFGREVEENSKTLKVAA